MLCGAALLGFASGVNAQVNAEQVLNIGRNVLSMEDYMLSIQYFNQAIKAKPYLCDPYFFRALAKLNLEDYKGAEDDCTLAIERNKFKTESYKLRGFARQNLGKDSLAVEDYDKGLLYNPEDKYFLYYKGVALTSMKRSEAAEEAFGKLLRIFPLFDEGYAARGRMRIQKGDTIGALADLDRSIEISKNSVNPYLVRAQIEVSRKEWDKAATDMDAAIRLLPQDADLYVNRAFIRYNIDDYFGAMSDYNYTLELEPYNSAALFNRALLRYEVRDLAKAADDFRAVLKYDPDNFHAQYNLGLVELDRKKYREALSSFDKIAKRYPKFYPVYYAKAEVYRDMGDMRTAMREVKTGDDLVRKYVKNPERNPLDRPKIAAGKSRTENATPNMDEGEIEVMDRFNQLVTVDHGSTQQLTYNEKIKGRVQDRDLIVELEPDLILSMQEEPASLNPSAGFLRTLQDFNSRRYIAEKIYLSSATTPLSEEMATNLFKRSEYYDGAVAEGKARVADFLGLGIARTMLKNYPAAIAALDQCVDKDPQFAMGYMARGYARQAYAQSIGRLEEGGKVDEELQRRRQSRALAQALEDYNQAIALNPKLAAAWYNKGNILSSQGDYTSAIQCYTEAIGVDPDFGRCYYNRGLAYLRIGNKRLAFADLSKAGELGVLPSYNLLKRMK